MNKLVLAISAVFFLGSSQVAFSQEVEKQNVIVDRQNVKETEEKPYVILISLDGFRWDYMDRYDANFLKKLAQNGLTAQSLIPSYPSVTFPNHYSIVTGLYPAHHGLVGNNILDVASGDRYSLRNLNAIKDPKWYGGTPLWVLAEQQGMLSACYYWPGSEAAIKNTLPTYYFNYYEKSKIEDRISEVVNWLELPAESRPHFITFYMPEVDKAGHRYGPESEETKKAVQYVDQSLEKLVDAVSKTGLSVNYVIVSDHGMLALDQETLLELPFKVDENELSIVSNGTYVSVFVKDKKNIDKWYAKIKKAAKPKLMQVYKHDDLPEHYNFGGPNDRFGRVGDIVLTANAPYYFTSRKLAGSHGYDPYAVKEMQGLFVASGPNIKRMDMLPSFENINIYPIVTSILGLKITEEIDGPDEVAKKIVK